MCLEVNWWFIFEATDMKSFVDKRNSTTHRGMKLEPKLDSEYFIQIHHHYDPHLDVVCHYFSSLGPLKVD